MEFNLYDLADKLRVRGWQVSAYSLPENATNIVVQRVLVRQGFGYDMAALFIEDFKRAVEELREYSPKKSLTEEKHGGFRH